MKKRKKSPLEETDEEFCEVIDKQEVEDWEKIKNLRVRNKVKQYRRKGII